MDKKTLYCLAVDDEPLALQVLENYIQQVPGLKLVAKCETLEEAFKALTVDQVNTVFLDLNLGPTSGIELVKKINAEMPSRYYIIVTSAAPSMHPTMMKEFNENKIILVDYITKPFSFDRFLTAIRKVFETIEKNS